MVVCYAANGCIDSPNGSRQLAGLIAAAFAKAPDGENAHRQDADAPAKEVTSLEAVNRELY